MNVALQPLSRNVYYYYKYILKFNGKSFQTNYLTINCFYRTIKQFQKFGSKENFKQTNTGKNKDNIIKEATIRSHRLI